MQPTVRSPTLNLPVSASAFPPFRFTVLACFHHRPHFAMTPSCPGPLYRRRRLSSWTTDTPPSSALPFVVDRIASQTRLLVLPSSSARQSSNSAIMPILSLPPLCRPTVSVETARVQRVPVCQMCCSWCTGSRCRHNAVCTCFIRASSWRPPAAGRERRRARSQERVAVPQDQSTETGNTSSTRTRFRFSSGPNIISSLSHRSL